VEALIAGLVIGLGSGVSPGPLLVLAITTTLRRGLRAGLLVACGPLVSDALIIGLSVTVVTNLPDRVAAALAFVGAVVVATFGVLTLREARDADVASLRTHDATEQSGRFAALASHPLAHATVINLVNPAPWLFWITAGSALLVGFWNQAPAVAFAYLVAFYVGLVGSKALVVMGIAAGRHRLSTRGYQLLLAAAGALLIVLAITLVIRGLEGLSPHVM